MIRTLLVLSLSTLVAASAVQAQTTIAPMATPGTAGGASVASRKQHIMSRIQQRMGILQSLQSCVTAAQDTTALRSCEEQARAANGSHEKKC